MGGPSLVKGLLQRIQHKAGMRGPAHPPVDDAARHVEPLAHHLSPDLARSIDLEVLGEHALDLGAQNLVP